MSSDKCITPWINKNIFMITGNSEMPKFWFTGKFLVYGKSLKRIRNKISSHLKFTQNISWDENLLQTYLLRNISNKFLTVINNNWVLSETQHVCLSSLLRMIDRTLNRMHRKRTKRSFNFFVPLSSPLKYVIKYNNIKVRVDAIQVFTIDNFVFIKNTK